MAEELAALHGLETINGGAMLLQTMQPGQRLEWIQESMWKRNWKLRSGEAEVGELSMVSATGSLATATVAGAAWTFKRTGFFSPQVTVRRLDSEEAIAVYTPHWGTVRGQLRIGAETLEFGSKSFWGGTWMVADGGGQELLSCALTGLLHHGVQITPSAAGYGRADLPMLVALCWYLLVLYIEDSVAAGGALAAMG